MITQTNIIILYCILTWLYGYYAITSTTGLKKLKGVSQLRLWVLLLLVPLYAPVMLFFSIIGVFYLGKKKKNKIINSKITVDLQNIRYSRLGEPIFAGDLTCILEVNAGIRAGDNIIIGKVDNVEAVRVGQIEGDIGICIDMNMHPQGFSKSHEKGSVITCYKGLKYG